MKTKFTVLFAALMAVSFSSNAQRGDGSSRANRTVTVEQKTQTNRGAKSTATRTVRREATPSRAQKTVTVERGGNRTVYKNRPATRATHVSRKQVVYKRGFEQRRIIRQLPARYTSFYHNGLRYHYADGRYYRTYGNGFVVSFAPVGYVVYTLPVGYIQTYCGGMPYYYFSGVYYQRFDRGYRVVEAPHGALVYQLPYGTEEVIVNGRVYYEYAGVLYKSIETVNGIAYEVAGQINV
jgi:hypothetical protein